MDKWMVEERLADWSARLEALFAGMDAWAESLPPDVTVCRDPVPQLIEVPMRKHGITDRLVPARRYQGPAGQVAFEPYYLWLPGCNGQVSVSTDSRPHTLLDMGGFGGLPSDWRFRTSGIHLDPVPFGKELFFEIVTRGHYAQSIAA